MTTHHLLMKVHDMIKAQSSAQEKLEEARFSIEQMENTIADLNQRIAFLES